MSRYILYMSKKPKLMDIDILNCASECLKVLGHPVRLRIIDILMQDSFTVKEISKLCSLPQNQISEHLRLMKSHNMLDSKRDGKTVYYEIVNPNLPEIIKCIKNNCRYFKRKRT